MLKLEVCARFFSLRQDGLLEFKSFLVLQAGCRFQKRQSIILPVTGLELNLQRNSVPFVTRMAIDVSE